MNCNKATLVLGLIFFLLTSSASSANDANIPITGPKNAKFNEIDSAMLEFMKQRDFKAATVAISRGRAIIFKHDYGWADESQTKKISPYQVMRIASISKPITEAAIKILIQQNKITLKTKVFEYLDIQPFEGRPVVDKRIYEITIEDLLLHKGGWDGDASFDPMFASRKISREMGLKGPPSAKEIIQYMMGAQLQFAPGEKTVYSNFGYCVLGRVIEKVSGVDYIEFIKRNIARPSGMRTLDIGHTSIKDRDPNEIWYSSMGSKEASVFSVEQEEMAPSADGGFYLEAMDSHGGLICSAGDLCKFLERYWINGDRRRLTDHFSYSFYGSLPGTTAVAIQRPDGYNIVALVNARKSAENANELHKELDVAMDKVLKK